MQVRFFTVVRINESSNADALHAAFGDDTPLYSSSVSTPTAYLFCISTASYTVEAIQTTCAKYNFAYLEEAVGVLDIADADYNSQHRTVRLLSAPFFALEAA